jgi:hypothetical protein
MKKILLSLLAIVAITIASCSDNTNQVQPTNQMFAKDYKIEGSLPIPETETANLNMLTSFGNYIVEHHTTVEHDKYKWVDCSNEVLQHDLDLFQQEDIQANRPRGVVLCHTPSSTTPNIVYVGVITGNGQHWLVLVDTETNTPIGVYYMAGADPCKFN